MSLTSVYDVSAVLSVLERLPEELREKASKMALNKTATKAKTEMKRQITSVYNLKSTDVAAALIVKNAVARNNIVSAVLYPVSISGQKKQSRAMNVIHFLEKSTTNADIKRRTKADTLNQLFFKFKKVGGKVHIRKTGDKSVPFIGNKGRTVFRRTGEPSVNDPRKEAIEPVQVIGMQQMFNTEALNEAVLRKAAADLLVETDRAVTLLLSRLK